MGTFFNVLSEQNITEHFFGVERSVLTEHLDPVFPRTLFHMYLISTNEWFHEKLHRKYTFIFGKFDFINIISCKKRKL